MTLLVLSLPVEAAVSGEPTVSSVCVCGGVRVAGKLVLVGAPVVRGTRISSPFGMRMHPVIKGCYAMHMGADIAAPYGTPVRAPWAGIVEKAGREERGGLVIRIKHDAALTRGHFTKRNLKHVSAGTR